MGKALSSVLSTLRWIKSNAEGLIVLVVASTYSALDLLDLVDGKLVPAITLAMLALLGFSILHDRLMRDALQRVTSRAYAS